MGVCTSSPQTEEEKARSQAIDVELREQHLRLRAECKILLLGSGESGKSTVVKQMKIIHQDGFSQDELALYRRVVNRNLVESAQAIVLAMRKFNLDPESGPNRLYAQKILDFQWTPDPEYTLPATFSEAVLSLWNDAVIPSVMEHSSDFYLMDSAQYFFDNAKRICDSKYVPNEDDVLRSRSKTTGITETYFNMGTLRIHMVDVGGQRSERKKWIHCFESITSIIFCVAISEYDQVLLEEKNQNRMKESLVLFESVVNSRWFISTSFVLFLNKIDVFREKLAKKPVEKYFPEYQGGNDIQKATKFFLWKFVNLNRAKLALYPHLTQATNTSSIRIVFAAVKETILQNALRDSGIL